MGGLLRRAPAAPAAAAALALACGLAAPGAGVQARPPVVEDLLQREAFGAIVVSPDGRWLLVEMRGPYASGSRFDRFLLNPLFRTRLMVADLERAGGLRPLLPPEPGHGYRLGPASPDGRYVAVYRWTDTRWELGIVQLAGGDVRWLGVTPEFSSVTRTLQWTSPEDLLVIARADGDLPYELRWMTPQAALPERWAASARGEVSVTVLGSGRYLGERPRSPPKALLTVSAADGDMRRIAEGDFVDLEAAPNGGRVALLEAAEDIPLTPVRPVQGENGMAARRTRLVVLDLSSGRLSRPCPEGDVLGGLLSWSEAGDALLAYVRDDGASWSAGRLVRIEARTGRARPVGGELRPVVERRPEVVWAGWWGSDPIVLARGGSDPRADWYRLGPEGAVRLTGALASAPREGLVVSDRALLMAADGAAWRIGPSGDAARLDPAPFVPIARRPDGVPGRPSLAPRRGETLVGVSRSPTGGSRLVELGAASAPAEAARLPEEYAALAAAGRAGGVLVVRIEGGGQETLEWRRPGVAPRRLAAVNTGQRDLDPPRIAPVPHLGPNGESLTSWLLLPDRSIDAPRPPPLIVLPYLGDAYGASPERLIFQQGPVFPAAPLVGRGYAVLLPSLPVPRGRDAPTEGLADQVLAIVTAAHSQPRMKGAFDPARLGLWGHSFGGYSALMILTQTDRFGAAVVQAAPSDLVSLHGAFSPAGRVHPDSGASTLSRAAWVEDLQAGMGRPPWAAPDRYVRNSPVMQARRIVTPLMLVHGDQDNFPVSQAEEMFTQLLRQNKDARLVTYWGEPHLYQSPGNLRDLYARLFAWYDEHLLGRLSASAGPRPNPEHGSATSGPRPPPPRPR